jgi:hypothetical protein
MPGPKLRALPPAATAVTAALVPGELLLLRRSW